MTNRDKQWKMGAPTVPLCIQQDAAGAGYMIQATDTDGHAAGQLHHFPDGATLADVWKALAAHQTIHHQM